MAKKFIYIYNRGLFPSLLNFRDREKNTISIIFANFGSSSKDYRIFKLFLALITKLLDLRISGNFWIEIIRFKLLSNRIASYSTLSRFFLIIWVTFMIKIHSLPLILKIGNRTAFRLTIFLIFVSKVSIFFLTIFHYLHNFSGSKSNEFSK